MLAQYQNGDYLVTLYDDGTKTREGNGKAITPETMDVKITDWCDAGCAFCHEKSTKAGLHADLQPTVDLIKAMPRGTEIAIGGGHPMAHPEFDNFLIELSSVGIICNVTVNEKHFPKERERIEKLISNKLIYGVGYSYQSIPCDWQYEHLVTHVIIGVTHPKSLNEIVRTNPKVLLLGYKSFGRGQRYAERFSDTVRENMAAWYRGLFRATTIAHLSFDNLAISQLNPKRLISEKDYNKFFMGEDGKFSMYLDSVKQEYAISSTSPVRYPFGKSIAEMFQSL